MIPQGPPLPVDVDLLALVVRGIPIGFYDQIDVDAARYATVLVPEADGRDEQVEPTGIVRGGARGFRIYCTPGGGPQDTGEILPRGSLDQGADRRRGGERHGEGGHRPRQRLEGLEGVDLHELVVVERAALDGVVYPRHPAVQGPLQRRPPKRDRIRVVMLAGLEHLERALVQSGVAQRVARARRDFDGDVEAVEVAEDPRAVTAGAAGQTLDDQLGREELIPVGEGGEDERIASVRRDGPSEERALSAGAVHRAQTEVRVGRHHRPLKRGVDVRGASAEIADEQLPRVGSLQRAAEGERVAHVEEDGPTGKVESHCGARLHPEGAHRVGARAELENAARVDVQVGVGTRRERHGLLGSGQTGLVRRRERDGPGVGGEGRQVGGLRHGALDGPHGVVPQLRGGGDVALDDRAVTELDRTDRDNVTGDPRLDPEVRLARAHAGDRERPVRGGGRDGHAVRHGDDLGPPEDDGVKPHSSRQLERDEQAIGAAARAARARRAPGAARSARRAAAPDEIALMEERHVFRRGKGGRSREVRVIVRFVVGRPVGLVHGQLELAGRGAWRQAPRAGAKANLEDAVGTVGGLRQASDLVLEVLAADRGPVADAPTRRRSLAREVVAQREVAQRDRRATRVHDPQHGLDLVVRGAAVLGVVRLHPQPPDGHALPDAADALLVNAPVAADGSGHRRRDQDARQGGPVRSPHCHLALLARGAVPRSPMVMFPLSERAGHHPVG